MNRKKRDFLAWPPLLKGTLLRRYKRFIADVRLQNSHALDFEVSTP